MSDIIEAAARALFEVDETGVLSNYGLGVGARVVAAVTPLIRAQVLEEVAKAMETREYSTLVPKQIAAAIRALKPASPSPSDASA